MTKKSSVKVVNTTPYIYAEKNIINQVDEKFKTIEPSLSKQDQLKLKSVRDKLGEEHPFDYTIVEDIVKNIALPNTVVEKISDFTVGPGLYIESEDEHIKEVLELWMEQTNFRYYIRPWFKEALIKGSGYLEIAGFNSTDMLNTLKVVNANTMYVVRDEFGTIVNFNQYVGDSTKIMDESKITKLDPEEIIQLNVNKIGSCGYGFGVIFPIIDILNDFILAQKSMHKIMKRKANSPVHWKLGNAEKNDYPAQGDIDAYGQKLAFMNDVTDWVTGPNAEAKVIDFGNIGEKFAEVLNNDYKLFSYATQVPEILLGSDRGFVGSSEVQMDAFERNCKSKQEELSFVIRDKIFNKVLEANGVTEFDYEISWGQASEDDKREEIRLLKDLINVTAINPGLKKELEQKIADLLQIEFTPMEPEQPDVQPTSNQPNPTTPPEVQKEEPATNLQTLSKIYQAAQKKEEEIDTIPGFGSLMTKLKENMKGKYKDLTHYMLCKESLDKDYNLQEWVNYDYKKSDVSWIVDKINKDDFADLKADSKTEEKAGYLNEKQIKDLKEVLVDAFKKNLNMRTINQKLVEDVKIKNLYEYNSKGLVKDEKGRRILLLDKEERSKIIARTETVRVAAEGKKDRLSSEGIDLVKWITAEDDRVCPICESVDGQIFELSQVDIPAHVNCRCIIQGVPVSEKLKLISGVLEEKLSPQEKELKLAKLIHTSETNVKTLIENYSKVKEQTVDKHE